MDTTPDAIQLQRIVNAVELLAQSTKRTADLTDELLFNTRVNTNLLLLTTSTQLQAIGLKPEQVSRLIANVLSTADASNGFVVPQFRTPSPAEQQDATKGQTPEAPTKPTTGQNSVGDNLAPTETQPENPATEATASAPSTETEQASTEDSAKCEEAK